jgi:hypothetical protein
MPGEEGGEEAQGGGGEVGRPEERLDLGQRVGDRDDLVAGRQAKRPQRIGGRRVVGLDDQLDRSLETGRRLQEPWRQAENGADIDVLARAWRAPGPIVAPARERAPGAATAGWLRRRGELDRLRPLCPLQLDQALPMMGDGHDISVQGELVQNS